MPCCFRYLLLSGASWVVARSLACARTHARAGWRGGSAVLGLGRGGSAAPGHGSGGDGREWPAVVTERAHFTAGREVVVDEKA
ncbi:hypothetical protein E2562_034529 [Oryza meyeriana var. granulata]|uniref:Secreted protein n=1 Tax=Oryza meyeriana var. granulata TaxID=110450 RepID=A0A6G1CAI4_9ORYZ|nr:hypothetical protein E2562_034529 [Oryza meyeriana var. granulata]